MHRFFLVSSLLLGSVSAAEIQNGSAHVGKAHRPSGNWQVNVDVRLFSPTFILHQSYGTNEVINYRGVNVNRGRSTNYGGTNYNHGPATNYSGINYNYGPAVNYGGINHNYGPAKNIGGINHDYR